jgi:plastocyanin
MRPRSFSLVPMLLACLVLAGGCGNSDDDDDGGNGSSGGGGTAYGSKKDDSKSKKDKATASSGAGQLKLTADPGGAPKFDKTSLSTKPGKTTIVLDNPSSVPHAIEVEGKGVEEEGETVEKGGVSKVTVDLKPGEYEYYCPVDGHKQAGMEGTLKVG